MLIDHGDRRQGGRRSPGPTEALSRVRLRAGRELAVIDVSAVGALVEGTTRLLPGTHVDVHITGAQGRVLVRARVVRCAVWSVSADVVQYRGALAFSSPIDLNPVEVAAASTVAAVAGLHAVVSPHSVPEKMWSGRE